MNSSDMEQPLQIVDLDGGLEYLAQLSLANPVIAERQLMHFYDALLAAPPEPSVLFTLLEQSRTPLCFVEEEMARRYHNRPLPLSEDEENCFQMVIAAWRKVGKAYALCARLEQPDTQNPQYVALVATILHRCLYYTGMVLLEHYRGRRELPPGIWLDLHGYYETAEEWGVAYTPVEDVLENTLQATHCAAAYAALLLVEIASPYSNSVRNLNLIRRWAGMWAPLVSIHQLTDDLTIPPYIVELMKDAPLHPTSPADEPEHDARRIDTSRLSLQISNTLMQLRQRITPSQLGLGEETSAYVISLLEHLARPWGQIASTRRFRRFATQGCAYVAVGFEAMHFCVTGKEFVQPDTAATYSRSEFDTLFTFGERAEPGQQLVIKSQTTLPVDEWNVINHSASGFRLTRLSAGQRIQHGQLMVIRPHDGEHFLLAQVTWLMQDDSGALVCGVANLPGVPTGIGIRPALQGAGNNERYIRAFKLPALAAVGEEASIVIPAGLYQASRMLDFVIDDEPPGKLRMCHILQRGTDFDRISYQLV